MDIVLKRSQIKQLIKIYEHFKEIEDFTLTLDEQGNASVKFNLNMVDKPETGFVPTTYK